MQVINRLSVILIGLVIFWACRKPEVADKSPLTCADLRNGIESHLATLYDLKFAGGDSLSNTNQEIVSLLKEIAQNKGLENCDLNLEMATYISSDDGRLKFLSWDTEGGGTMKEIATVAIFQDKDSVKVELLVGEDGGNTYENFYEIHTLQNNHGETLYLVKTYLIGSTIIRRLSVKCFQIKNGLVQVAAFPNGQNELAVGYEESSFLADSAIDINVLEQGKKLYIPVVYGDSLTGHYEEFNFNGKAFVSAQKP